MVGPYVVQNLMPLHVSLQMMLEPGDLVKLRGTKGWVVVVHASSRMLIGEATQVVRGRYKKDIMFFNHSDVVESYRGD